MAVTCCPLAPPPALDPGEWAESADGIASARRTALFPDGPSTLGGEGSVLASIAGPGAPSVPQVLLVLAVTTAIFALIAVFAFVRSERRAKDLGMLDRTSAY